MSKHVLERLQARFADQVEETHSNQGDDPAYVKRDKLVELLTFLRDDAELAFNLPVDLTVVDWYQKREPRFEVVYHLYSTTKKHRVRLKVRVDEDDARVPSSFDLPRVLLVDL